MKQGDKTAVEFDRLFGEATDQLMKYGRLIQSFDSKYVARVIDDQSYP